MHNPHGNINLQGLRKVDSKLGLIGQRRFSDWIFLQLLLTDNLQTNCLYTKNIKY